jgi:D-cysteine desulfhydrase
MINFGPTPIHVLNENFYNNTYYIKREDLLPFSFGGNKARKGALFFEDLKKKGYNYILTYGSSSSNHCRIIANIAGVHGIPCHIISPSESNHPTYNSKMIKMVGALVTESPISRVNEAINKQLDELRSQGYKPYFIQGGGHGDIGTQAYVNAYEEIINYESSTGEYFDYIFHASGTGTTQAGLICGKLIHGNKREIVGISIARKNPYGSQVVLESVNSYLNSIDKGRLVPKIISFVDDYILEGYGTFNNHIMQTIKEVLIHEGIPLDTTYTGKAFWGMKEYIKSYKITGKKILFIHTGGTPLFFEKLEDLKNEL